MKGIPMKTWEVQAILDNRKTVARRVVKPQPVCYGPNVKFKPHDDDFFLSAEKNWLRCRVCGHDPEYSREGSNTSHHWIPPYRPGDILYVRETFTKYQTVNFIKCHDGRAFSEVSDGQFAYKADGYESIDDLKDNIRLLSDCSLEAVEVWDDKWHPSIHMPREAARIFLRVTDVRVERLQNITELDILEKEGITVDFPQPKPSYISLAYTETRLKPAVRKAFTDLWNSTLNPKDRALYGWEANPWVWMVEFESISNEEAKNEAD